MGNVEFHLLNMIYRPFLKIAFLLMMLIMLSACERQCRDADLWFNRGQNALVQGRHDLAREYFARDLEQNPDRVESLRKLGFSWLDGGNGVLSTAITYLDQYIQLNPDDGPAQVKRARALIRAGDWKRLEQLDLASSADISLRLLAAEALIARADIEPSRILDDLLLDILETDPQHIRAHEQAAILYQQIGDMQMALQYAERAAALGSMNPKTYYQISQSANRLKDADKARMAIAQFQALESITKRRSVTGYQPDQLNKTLAVLEQNPYGLASNAEFIATRIQLLFDSGDRNTAIQHYQEYVSNTSFTSPQHLSMAAAALRAGALDTALNSYREAASDPDTVETAELGKAHVALLQAKYADLDAISKAAIERHCWIARHHYYLSQAAMRRGDDERSRTALNDALHLSPWQTEWRILMANLLLSDGDIEEAKRLLDEAPVIDPALSRFRREQGL